MICNFQTSEQERVYSQIAEDYSEWNSDKIVARQNGLARQLVGLWRLDL